MTQTPPPVLSYRYVVEWEVDNGTAEDEDDILCNEFAWPDIDISYNPKEYQGKVPLPGQNVRARILQETRTEGEVEEVSYTPVQAFTVQEMSIRSSHPTNNNWIYPNNDSLADPNAPTEYGGAFLYDMDTPQQLKYPDMGKCGVKEGFVNWIDSQGSSRTSVSGYIYVSVFEKTDFSFIPFNEDDPVQMKDRQSFMFEPYFPDVKDPIGKSAPILPMNAITSFNPDGRETVTIKYTVTFRGEVMGLPVEGQCFIKQDCYQKTDDYGEILSELLTYCNWANTRDIKPDEFSYLYPYRYPYTYVTTKDPTKDHNPKRGDIWYNYVTKERQYFTSGDVPQTFEVLEGGTLYKDRDNVQASWTVPRDENGLPLRKSQYHMDEENVPHSLKVNIKTENGKVVSAVISDLGTPANFKDGDIVSVLGGNGDARLRVNISTPPGWTDTIVKKYGN
jgi:hypothetical protein